MGTNLVHLSAVNDHRQPGLALLDTGFGDGGPGGQDGQVDGGTWCYLMKLTEGNMMPWSGLRDKNKIQC